MDIDFWTSRIHSAKQISAAHASRHHPAVAMDDSDGDEDARACFPCPFCYVDIEINVLCTHLQDEHCFDFKNAVCPLCAANLGKDAIGHFIVQHASSLKRRRKSQKSALWPGNSNTLGKDLSSFLGSSTDGRGNSLESASDSLLLPFLSAFPHSDPKGSHQDESSDNNPLHTNKSESDGRLLPNGGNEVDNEERKQKAAFVQQLIASTIF